MIICSVPEVNRKLWAMVPPRLSFPTCKIRGGAPPSQVACLRDPGLSPQREKGELVGAPGDEPP